MPQLQMKYKTNNPFTKEARLWHGKKNLITFDFLCEIILQLEPRKGITMTIGFIGERNHISELLETMFDLHFYDESDSDIGSHRLYIRNPKKMEAVKQWDIPTESILINIFKVRNSKADGHSFVLENEQQNNFLVEYPGMSASFLLKKIESILLGSEFDVQTSSHTILEESHVSTLGDKNKWLVEFREKLSKNSPSKDREFSRTVTTLVDELILNAFIHGYGMDPKEPSLDEIGPVKIKWIFDNINFSILVEDQRGKFDTEKFLNKQSMNKSAEEISNNQTGGLGFLMCIKFCDHIEIVNKKGQSTSTRLFIDLNRNLFSKMRKSRSSSLLILNQ